MSKLSHAEKQAAMAALNELAKRNGGRITAEQLGLSPYLMCAANSTGGVMGKMVDAQSIVVAGVSARAEGQEAGILRFVFWHSLVLAALISAWVAAQAYWPPLQATVVR